MAIFSKKKQNGREAGAKSGNENARNYEDELLLVAPDSCPPTPESHGSSRLKPPPQVKRLHRLQKILPWRTSSKLSTPGRTKSKKVSYTVRVTSSKGEETVPDSQASVRSPISPSVREDPHCVSDFQWFPGCVSLSILEHGSNQGDENQSSFMGKMSVLVTERSVRASCIRHLQLNCCSASSDPKRCANSCQIENAQKLISEGKYDSAIEAAKDVLKMQRAKDDKGSAAVTTLARQLSLLCLAAGRRREAAQYSAEALEFVSTTKTGKVTQQEAETVALVLFQHWLVLLCGNANKADQAVKTWRKAMSIVAEVSSYQNEIVATLQNNIGVMLLEAGQFKRGLQSLEKSLKLHKTNLSRVTCVAIVNDASVDNSVYRMATTMGNLAIACVHNKQYDRAISLLNESMALYESNAAETDEIEEIIRQTMDFILLREPEKSDQEKMPLLAREDPENSGTEFAYSEDVFSDLDDDDDDGASSCMSMPCFENTSKGIIDRKAAARLTMEQSDRKLDFLLLGRLSPELSTEDRVHEAVLAWFGKSLSSPRKVESTRASSYLQVNDIHEQVMYHLDLDNIDSALTVLQSTLHSLRTQHGIAHPLVASCLHNLGMVHLYDKQYSEALRALEATVVVRTDVLGPDHPDVQSSIMKIALIQFAQGECRKARETIMEIRSKFLEVCGYEHPQLATIHNNIGVIAYELGHRKSAMVAFKKAFEYQRLLIGKLSSDTADIAAIGLAAGDSLSNLAFVHFKKHEHEKALRVYERSLKIYRKHLPSQDRRVKEVLENMNLIVGWFDSVVPRTQLCSQPHLTCLADQTTQTTRLSTTPICDVDETMVCRQSIEPVSLPDQKAGDSGQSKLACLSEQTRTDSRELIHSTCTMDQTSGSLLEIFDAIASRYN